MEGIGGRFSSPPGLIFYSSNTFKNAIWQTPPHCKQSIETVREQRNKTKEGAKPINLISSYPEHGLLVIRAQKQTVLVRARGARRIEKRGHRHQSPCAIIPAPIHCFDFFQSSGEENPLS
ncbi:MAG: hypothetical protein H7832_11985 [Magnetococcus sp. DMHC-6]